MYTRRHFLETIGRPAAAAMATAAFAPDASAHLLGALSQYVGPPEVMARDEAFWSEVQQAFTVDRTLIDLNNGGVCPSPALVQEAMQRHLAYSNQAPAYTMWKILEPQRESVRRQLAEALGCDAEEVALTRNATESMQICQFGFDLQPGDEIVTTNQDFFRMLNTWRQRERREGIVLKQFPLPVPAEDPAEVVARFEAHLTDRTRLILMCHVINLTGQILPVKAIVAMARQRGIPVIVDGAQAFAHLDFTLADLGCDYYATSLHKWLMAPHGTGLLYVRKDRIRDLWPLMAAPERLDDDIRKFEQVGTHPAANYLATAEALTFHQHLGPARKEARLRYLRDYWVAKLLPYDRFRLHTSLKPAFSCGFGTVQIEGIDAEALRDYLWEAHRIIVRALNHDHVKGLRVTPNVFTTLAELDRFTEAMDHVIRYGLPEA